MSFSLNFVLPLLGCKVQTTRTTSAFFLMFNSICMTIQRETCINWRKGKAVCLRCYNHNNNNWAEVAIYTKHRLSDAVNEPKCAKKCYRLWTVLTIICPKWTIIWTPWNSTRFYTKVAVYNHLISPQRTIFLVCLKKKPKYISLSTGMRNKSFVCH